MINVDQSPIGRTPRSNPATYTGLFTPIRELFASVPEARLRGYQPGRFSFNVKGGRCEACQGDGYIEIEMQFLPDVTVPCEVCKGKRYNREALEILFRGKNIAEVLEMTVDEALEFFTAFPKVRSKLQTLKDVGLGYITLGQPATTVSGGEAQRVKLSTELSRRSTGRTLYILDEPTTGLSLRGRAQPARRAAAPGRRRQHGRGHRAPPRRDAQRRPHHRPRAPWAATAAARSWRRARRSRWRSSQTSLTASTCARLRPPRRARCLERSQTLEDSQGATQAACEAGRRRRVIRAESS